MNNKGILMALFLAIFQFSGMFAQERVITGTVVTSSDGMPLPGVNVTVENTNRGTVTDFDGNYSIEAATGQVLVFLV